MHAVLFYRGPAGQSWNPDGCLGRNWFHVSKLFPRFIFKKESVRTAWIFPSAFQLKHCKAGLPEHQEALLISMQIKTHWVYICCLSQGQIQNGQKFAFLMRSALCCVSVGQRILFPPGGFSGKTPIFVEMFWVFWEGEGKGMKMKTEHAQFFPTKKGTFLRCRDSV